MITPVCQPGWTDDAIMALPQNGKRYELRKGELVIMSPAGAQHGEIAVRLVSALSAFVEKKRLGNVYDSSTGFRLSPDICYSPDIAFVCNDRLRLLRVEPEKFLQGAPDLAVEVLSPTDSLREMTEKVKDYFQHGTSLAWVIDPQQRLVRIYREPMRFAILRGNSFLTGHDLLPGFRHSLRRLFADPAF